MEISLIEKGFSARAAPLDVAPGGEACSGVRQQWCRVEWVGIVGAVADERSGNSGMNRESRVGATRVGATRVGATRKRA